VFDISFFELILCAIVALVVIGPERLPETVRTVGLWIGRLKRSLRETRSELERQLGTDDIRRQLHNEEIMQSLERTRREIEGAIKDGEQSEPKPQTYNEHVELPDHAHMDEIPKETPKETTLPADRPTPATDKSNS
jgi:sec-independent protein translocase protein TatB